MMVQRRAIFKAVADAVESDADIIMSLKEGKLTISVGESDKIGMDVLEFLYQKYGDLTIGQLQDALHAASWWLVTTQVL